MSAAKCIHRDILLTRKEREEGGCDSCGKRLSASLKARGASLSAALYPAASGAGNAVGGLVIFLVAIFILVGLFALTGDPSFLAPLIVIPIVAVAALIRLIRSPGRVGN
jgi:hypothetical protein